MNKAQTISPKDKPFASEAARHLDYDFLREEGLRHIQDLSGQLWTDHNTHDPGITILEVLCYALTDLAYRSQLPDAEIFAPPPQKRLTDGDDNFPSAYTILSCNPLTELDWRKLLLDIEGVRNAWLIPIETNKSATQTIGNTDGTVRFSDKTVWGNPLWESESLVFLNKDNHSLSHHAPEGDFKYPLSIRGIYSILLELETGLEDRAPVLAEVNRRLAGHRNLCEDFGDIRIVRDEPLTLCAEFELEASAQADEVMLSIFTRLQEFFSPTIRFYTLSEMLKKGRNLAEIFEGRPILAESHGFLDTTELENIQQHTEIRISDIYRLLLGDDLSLNPEGKTKVEGLSAIRKLLIKNPQQSQKGGQSEWTVPITEGARPILNMMDSIASTTFYKRGIPYRVNKAQVISLFEKELANTSKIIYKLKEEKEKGRQNLDTLIPTGEHRSDLGEHISIQEDFPVYYGVGSAGLPATAGTDRRIKAAQLKGYLTFYDHLLANYLEQLARIRPLFSPKLLKDSLPLPSGAAAEKEWLGLSADAFDSLAPTADLRQSIPNSASLFGFAQKETVVEIGSENLKPIPTLFQTDEIIASSHLDYASPYDRDRALRQFIADMDAGNLVPELRTIQQEGELDTYRFQYTSRVSRTVSMTSTRIFQTQAEALAAAAAIRFVATLEEAYDKIDDTAAQTYAFRLRFSPPQYETYLRRIAESETDFFNKKNQIFDHLLARFAEDFTDYTLLSFAHSRNAGLEINQADSLVFSRRFALDKARFLENYPSISRNRARAMDFSKNLWTDANQSGLENRVSKLIGIDERGTKTLNYFDSVQKPTRYRFLVVAPVFSAKTHDDIGIQVAPNDKILMRSSQSYETPEDAQFAYQDLCSINTNGYRFERTEANLEQVFSFRLLDKRGCPVAEAVETFGSAVLRDRHLLFTKGILEGAGVMPHFAADTEGVYFEIYDMLGGYFKAQKGANDADAAKYALVETLLALLNKECWQIINEETGRGFGFQIIDNQKVLAVYSRFFTDIAARDAHQKKVLAFFKTKKPLWQTQAHAPRYRWFLSTANGATRLYARHYFGSPAQAAAAWLEAKRAIVDTRFGQLVRRTERGQYYLEIQRYVVGAPDDSLVLAQAVFEQSAERDTAYWAFRHLAQALAGRGDAEDADFWASQSTRQEGAAALDTEGGRFSLRLTLPNLPTGEGVFGDPLFDSTQAALAATFKVLEKDAEGLAKIEYVGQSLTQDYQLFSENGGCIHSFNIQTGEALLGTYAPFDLSEREAKRKAVAIQKAIEATACLIQLRHVVNHRWFEVWDETCAGDLVPILRGAKKTLDAAGIRQHFTEFKKELPEPTVLASAEGFRFAFGDWAKSVATFKTEKEAKEQAAIWFARLKTDLNNKQVNEPTETLPTNCPTMSLPHPFRWELRDTDDRLARYQNRRFAANQVADAEAVKEALVRTYACCPPFFSHVFENTGNIDADDKGNPVFLLRDAQYLYWRILSPDNTEGDFEQVAADILTLARLAQNYRLSPRLLTTETGDITLYRVELQNDEGKTVAESADFAQNTEGVQNLMARLQSHALAYPIVQKAVGVYGFQIFDSQTQSIVWESLPRFDTIATAKKGFKRFLSLLQNRTHYQIRTTADNCYHFIELVELLLEEVSPQKFETTVYTEPHSCDWQAIETFVDDLLLAEAQSFVPTIDYINGGGHGFQIARKGYRVARLTEAFHSKTKREERRDNLWQNYHCRPKTADIEPSAILTLMGFLENGKAVGRCLDTTTDPKKHKFQEAQLFDTAGKSVYTYPDVFNDATEVEAFFERRRDAYREALQAMPNLSAWTVLRDIAGFLRLGINRADGTWIIIFEEWTTHDPTVMATEIARLYTYVNFNSAVIALPQGGFGFEIREKTAKTEAILVNGLTDVGGNPVPVLLPIFKTIWRHIETYKTETAAQRAADKACLLLGNKNNYARATAADGAPTLELVDAHYIIARHPRYYTTAKERDAAWQNVQAHIHTEGMHLVEHLLLRPRSKPKEALEIAAANALLLSPYTDDSFKTEFEDFDPTDADDRYNDTIMGADPYSFWMTAVLPHWSARFRDLDFRDFFERLIRREAPAHVAVQILWVTPEQMQSFEKVWRAWLEVAMQPDHNLYNCRKKCLIEVFKNLRSVTPEAGLLDCKEGVASQLIYLDKTTLR
jgi:hypothetical protein